MHENDDPMAERLLDLEPHDASLRGRYKANLGDQLDRRLAGPRRGRYAVVGLAGLAMSLVCGSLALTEPESTPAATRALLGLFAFLGLGWTLLGARVLARGDGDFVDHRMLAARMAFGFTLITVVALSFASYYTGRAAVGMPMAATGLALLIAAAVLLIDARIERAESSIREQILRMEARLAAAGGHAERGRDGGG